MQFTTLLAAALAVPALVMGATPTAKVVNNCAFPIYVKSVPNNGGKPGLVRHLAANGGMYSEPFKASGSNIYAGTQAALSTPLTLGYTPSDGRVYYDMGDEFGNPFLAYRNTLTTAAKGCPMRNCAPNDEECYSDAKHQHILNCEATSLTMELCA